VTGPVLHVITRLEAGGAPNTLLLLLEGLSARGIAVELATGLTEPPAEDLLDQARELGFPIHVIPSLRRDLHPLHDLAALFSLWRLMRRIRPVLVHAHTSKGGFMGRLAALLAGVKIRLYTPHGTVLTGYFGSTAEKIFAWLERLSARWTTRIIGLNRLESEAYLAAGIGRAHQHRQIENGIELERFSPLPEDLRRQRRHEEGIGDDEVVMITVGRLVPVKDQLTLIAALGQLAEDLPAWRLMIVGEGPERSALEERTRSLGLTDRIAFLGQREDVPGLLGLSDLFVLTSVNEGFGLVLVEAMAGALPVIATAVGGIPEVVIEAETGLLVPAGDPPALARALERLLIDPDLRQRLGTRGREIARERYGVDRMVEKTIALYEEVLGDPGGSGNRSGLAGRSAPGEERDGGPDRG